MARFKAIATSPRLQVIFNGVMWVGWLSMVPVTLLVGSLQIGRASCRERV